MKLGPVTPLVLVTDAQLENGTPCLVVLTLFPAVAVYCSTFN